MKMMVRRIAVGVVMVVLISHVLIHADSIELREFLLTEDSANSTTWTLGSSAAGAADLDFDTSITYDPRYWDNLTLQVKFAGLGLVVPSAATADSGAATIVLQMSNDEIYWAPIDSALAPDSLAFFKNMSKQYYRYARFLAHTAAKTNDSGASGTVKVMVRGVK